VTGRPCSPLLDLEENDAAPPLAHTVPEAAALAGVRLARCTARSKLAPCR
jgi:hypothetical protein